MLVIWYKIHCAGVLWHVGGPFSVWKALLSLWNWTPGGGRLWGCRRGGVGHFKAVTYLWNNPQSFKLNLLLISCSSYLSQHRRTVDVFMDLPLVRAWFLASGDWLVCMSAVGASVRLGQSREHTEIKSSSLNCSSWNFGLRSDTSSGMGSSSSSRNKIPNAQELMDQTGCECFLLWNIWSKFEEN